MRQTISHSRKFVKEYALSSNMMWISGTEWVVWLLFSTWFTPPLYSRKKHIKHRTKKRKRSIRNIGKLRHMVLQYIRRILQILNNMNKIIQTMWMSTILIMNMYFTQIIFIGLSWPNIYPLRKKINNKSKLGIKCGTRWIKTEMVILTTTRQSNHLKSFSKAIVFSKQKWQFGKLLILLRILYRMWRRRKSLEANL